MLLVIVSDSITCNFLLHEQQLHVDVYYLRRLCCPFFLLHICSYLRVICSGRNVVWFCTHALLNGLQHGLLFILLHPERSDAGFMFTQPQGQVHHLLLCHLWKRQMVPQTAAFNIGFKYKPSRPCVVYFYTLCNTEMCLISYLCVWICFPSPASVFLSMIQDAAEMTGAPPERTNEVHGWFV